MPPLDHTNRRPLPLRRVKHNKQTSLYLWWWGGYVREQSGGEGEEVAQGMALMTLKGSPRNPKGFDPKP